MSAANPTHQTPWTGQNLPIMRGMNLRPIDGLDPRFNPKESHGAPIGSLAIGPTQSQTNPPTRRLYHG